jgi:hypothetical protein
VATESIRIGDTVTVRPVVGPAAEWTSEVVAINRAGNVVVRTSTNGWLVFWPDIHQIQRVSNEAIGVKLD